MSLAGDLPCKLTDVQLVHVFRMEGKQYSIPKTLGYYRAPSDAELPLNLNERCKSFVNYERNFYGKGMRCFPYIMRLERPLSVLSQFDICSSRSVLVKLVCRQKFTLLATKFRDCIYLRAKSQPLMAIKSESAHLFKLRKYLTVGKYIWMYSQIGSGCKP